MSSSNKNLDGETTNYTSNKNLDGETTNYTSYSYYKIDR